MYEDAKKSVLRSQVGNRKMVICVCRGKDFTLMGHFVFPWLRRFGKFPISIHVFCMS